MTPLYDPELSERVTRTAQLVLRMLIEKLRREGVDVTTADTEGPTPCDS